MLENNLSTAEQIATKFSQLPQVVAIVLAGSQTSNFADRFSDLDIYVYSDLDIAVDFRASIVKEFANKVEVNNQFWEHGDELLDINSGCGIDIMYRSPVWIEAQIDRLLVKHQASIGYSTCFWWNVLHSRILYSRDTWFEQLQLKANQPYPEQLRQAIVAKNYPILRNNISSYFHQIQIAINRNDIVTINHRIAALIASYFDIIFAINYLPHPGEKRSIQFANNFCKKLPLHMEKTINSIFASILYPLENQNILQEVNTLLDALDELLNKEKLL